MKTRVLTAIAILAFVIPALLFGGFLVVALVEFIIAGASHELIKLEKKNWPVWIEPFIILALMASIFVENSLLISYISILAIILLATTVFSQKFSIKDAFYCIAFSYLFANIGNNFLVVYDVEPLFIWFIILVTYACDTFAYLCGRAFGKHKLAPKISPNKTIEGSIGGWVFAFLISFVFAKLCVAQGYIAADHLLALSVASFLLPLVGQIGDLVFSAIKRFYQIKDYSNLLPGHGGVLDRVDSLLFNLVVFNFIYLMVNL